MKTLSVWIGSLVAAAWLAAGAPAAMNSSTNLRGALRIPRVRDARLRAYWWWLKWQRQPRKPSPRDLEQMKAKGSAAR